jgi:hypothetical protein
MSLKSVRPAVSPTTSIAQRCWPAPSSPSGRLKDSWKTTFDDEIGRRLLLLFVNGGPHSNKENWFFFLVFSLVFLLLCWRSISRKKTRVEEKAWLLSMAQIWQDYVGKFKPCMLLEPKLYFRDFEVKIHVASTKRRSVTCYCVYTRTEINLRLVRSRILPFVSSVMHVRNSLFAVASWG